MKNGWTNARKWLGSGLFTCHCDSVLLVNYSRHGDRQYQCRPSGHLARSAKPIDELVEQVVVQRLRRPDLINLLATDDKDDVRPLRDEAATLRLRLDRFTNEYGEGLITGKQLREVTVHVQDQLNEVEASLAQAGRAHKLAPLIGAADPGQAGDSDLSVRQSVIETLCTIKLMPGQRGRAPFYLSLRCVRVEAGMSYANGDQIRQQLAESKAEASGIVALYEAMESANAMKAHTLVEYRCRSRCLLARSFRTPGGDLCLYAPPYKLSDARTDELQPPSTVAPATDWPAGSGSHVATTSRRWPCGTQRRPPATCMSGRTWLATTTMEPCPRWP